MHYLDKRIQVICDQLKKQCVLKSEPVINLFYKKGTFHHCEEAHADEAAFAPFDSHSMFWYGADEHYWFCFDCDLLPESGHWMQKNDSGFCGSVLLPLHLKPPD